MFIFFFLTHSHQNRLLFSRDPYVNQGHQLGMAAGSKKVLKKFVINKMNQDIKD